MKLPASRDTWVWLRARFEWIGACGAGAAAIYWREVINTQFADKVWNAGAFYAAVFQWSSIQAAFLFGVYAFFLSRSEPFIQAIAPSPAFRLLRKFLVRILYLSLGLCVITLPMLVVPIVPVKGQIGFPFWFLWLNAVLLTYTFLCFFKVVRIFGKIERRG